MTVPIGGLRASYYQRQRFNDPEQFGKSSPVLISLPAVVLNLTTGYVGSTVNISGAGFAANSPIRITYDDTEITLQELPQMFLEMSASLSLFLYQKPERTASR